MTFTTPIVVNPIGNCQESSRRFFYCVPIYFYVSLLMQLLSDNPMKHDTANVVQLNPLYYFYCSDKRDSAIELCSCNPTLLYRYDVIYTGIVRFSSFSFRTNVTVFRSKEDYRDTRISYEFILKKTNGICFSDFSLSIEAKEYPFQESPFGDCIINFFICDGVESKEKRILKGILSYFQASLVNNKGNSLVVCNSGGDSIEIPCINNETTFYLPPIPCEEWRNFINTYNLELEIDGNEWKVIGLEDSSYIPIVICHAIEV